MFDVVYIHAGLPKTGSSYLQNCFSALAENKKFKTIYYPKNERYAAESGNGNGINIASHLIPSLFPAFDETEFEYDFAELLKGTESSVGNLLISSEDFFSASIDRFECFKKRLLEVAKEIKLILVVRPLKAWTHSYYMQMVKRHAVSHELDEGWLNAFQQEVVEKFEAVDNFSVETLVLPYSDAGLLRSFLHCIGEDVELEREVPEGKENRSLTSGELKWLKMVNGVFQSERLSGLLSDEFIRRSSLAPAASFEGGSAVLYAEFSRSLLNGLDSFESKLMRDIKNILFSAESEVNHLSPESTGSTDEILFEITLLKIKSWLDEGGDLYHKVRDYAEASLQPTRSFFDPVHYLIMNEDVLRLGIDPWRHYLVNGKSEGRASAFVRHYRQLPGDQSRHS
jgi:hypothetical protein